MKKFGLYLILFFALPYFSQAQVQLDSTTEYLYKFDMKYTGSNAEVDPYYIYRLEQLMEFVNENDSIELHVRGHVCCGPSRRLSRRRARKAYRFLIRLGIDKKRISYKGYSDKAPLRWPEKKEEDEIANRRVDFVIRKIK